MLANFYKKYIDTAAFSNLDGNEKDRAIRLNQIVVGGILLMVFNTLLEAYLRLPYTVILDILFIACLFVIYHYNNNGHYKIARNIAIISVGLLLLVGSYLEGVDAGNYLVFIPMLIIFSIIIRIDDKIREVAYLAFFTALCIFASIKLCPNKSNTQSIADETYKMMYEGNLFITLCLTALFTYIVYNIGVKREKLLLEAKLQAEESSKAKSQFLSTMSHELRTPLNGIIGTSNLLLSEKHLPEQNQHLDLLRYSSKHMLSLINDVLDFSKIEAGKIELAPESFSLNHCIAGIVAVYKNQCEAKGISFDLQKYNLPQKNIISDATRLNQVLYNLLSNALKFTTKGGIIFSIKCLQEEHDTAVIEFSVKDTGIGIAKEKLETIFEGFSQADVNTTRKYGGTGLGLTISKEMTLLLGGKLCVDSVENEGSNFYFKLSLPLDNVYKPITKELISPDVNLLTGVKVLLAEDNPVNIFVARKFLNKWGAITTEATNGKQAIDYFNTNTFDILLLDLEMPEADGYAVLRHAKIKSPNVPAIAFTAASFENITVQLAKAGFNDFVSKPFSPNELFEKMNKLLKN